MALPLKNNAEGGSDETTVTTGNSGGLSGDAFDTVSIDAGAALVFDSAQAAHGGFSYRFQPDSQIANTSVEWNTSIGTVTEIWGRFYVYHTANPSSHEVAKFFDGANDLATIFIATGGIIRLRNEEGTEGNTDGTVAIALNAWNRVEFHLIFHGTTGLIEAKLFKAPDSSTPDETITRSNTNTGTQCNEVRMGCVSGSASTTGTHWLDDLQLNSTGYPGPAGIEPPAAAISSAAPAATSTYSQATPPSVINVAAPAPKGPIAAPAAAISSAAPATSIGVGIIAPAAALIAEAPPPLSPSRTFGAILLRQPARIGTVVHEVLAPDGESDWPIVEDWTAREEAPGGFTYAAGRIPLSVMRKRPEVYRFGSIWRSYLAETGECLWAGRLVDPAVEDGAVLLAAKGWAVLAEREADMVTYQSYDTARWEVDHSGYGGDPNHPDTVLWTLDADADGGGFTWRRPKHSSKLQGYSLVHLESQGNEGTPLYSELYFHYQVWQGNTNKVELSVTGSVSEIYTTTLTGSTGGTVTMNAEAPYYNFHILFRDASSDWGSLVTARAVSMRVSGSGVTGDSLGAGALVRDICGRLRVNDFDVRNGGGNVLPYELHNQPFADGLDFAALTADWRWLFLDRGRGPYCDFGPWSKRVWGVADEWTPVRLIPLERYDRVRISIPLNGRLGTFRRLVLSPKGRLPYANTYSLEWPEVSSDRALDGNFEDVEDSPMRNLAEKVADYLWERRWGGGATLSEVRDHNGFARSAHSVRAGDVINHWPSGSAGMRVRSLTRTDREVSVEFDEELGALNRLVARQQKRMERKRR